MNNKKVQAHMQIDVSFVANTTKLVKELENSTKKLNLGSAVTRDLATNLSKGFKEVYGNLNKMVSGLSKKGLSSKQYTAFFDSINDRLQQSLDFTKDLKKSLTDAFNSPANKQAIKDLEHLKNQLIEINKLAKLQSSSQTRQNTSKKKLKEETGLDFDTSRKMLNSMLKRKANKQDLTRNQQDWAQANGLDDTKLKRALELMKQINSQAEKIVDLNNQAKGITGQNGVAPSVETLEKSIAKLENDVFNESAYKQNLKLVDGIEQLDGVVTKATHDLDPGFKSALSTSEAEAQKLAQASSTIKEIFAQFGIAFSATTIVRGFQDLARSAFDFYKSLDSALNEIYVVSSLSSDAVNGLQDSFITMAKNTGMALDDVTRSAVLFYQQGLNTDEVMEMTRVTSEFAKVAGIDATDAADKLTAAVNGYCLAAEDASSVADKFNKVAAATAADINELSTAFSKAAAQANQAGVSMDNYLAYIATMEEATREAPENIGTSLKTIFSRMQQIKTGNNTEDTTDVNQVETALKSVGIALRDAQGELRDLEEIFDELGPKWNSLDRNTQAYLGTIIAGTRQQSRFITLMQNWDRVLDVAEQSANSAGMQALMHAKAMDSIESKLQQLQVAWQEFVSNLASSDLFKGAIEGLTKLIKLVNSGNKPMILLAGAIALIGKKLKELQIPLINKLKDFKNIFGGKSFTSTAEQKQALNQNLEEQKRNKQELENKERQQDWILKRKEALEKEEGSQEELNRLVKKEKELQEDINRLKKEGNGLTKEEEEIREASIKTKMQKVGDAISGIGMITSSLGLMSGDANTSGILGTAGMGMTSVGQFMSGNWLGGTMSALTALYQGYQTYKNWDKNLEKKITDSVDKTSNKLEEVNNTGTVIRSTENLLKKYDQLNNKIIRTESEQAELNSIVQELGDTHSIETVEDEYGNLLININEVNEALNDLKDKQDALMVDLKEIEFEAMDEATSGLFNTNEVSEYIDKLFKTSSSKYKDLMGDFSDNLTKDTRAVSETAAKSLISNIKNELINDAKTKPGLYFGEGFGNSLKRREQLYTGTENVAGLSTQDWNELYSEIEWLKSDLNNLSFNEVQKRIDEFYKNWSGNQKIVGDDWETLKNSINDTVFDNNSLIKYLKRIDTMEQKTNQGYYSKEKEYLKKQLKEMEDYAKFSRKELLKINGAMLLGGSALGPAGTAIAGIGGATWWVANEYDIYKREAATKKRLKEIERDEKNYKYDVAKEQNFYLDKGKEKLDIDRAEKWINAQIKVKNAMKEINGETAEFLTNIESFGDFSDLGADQYEEYAKILNNIIPQLETEATKEGRTNLLVKLLTENMDGASPEIRAKMQTLLDDSFRNLELPQGYTFTQIAETLDTISGKLIDINDLVATFNENGALTLDEFKDLASILDSFNPENLFAISDLDNGINYVNDYINALKRLDLAYDANNGMITMNGEALNDLRAIQEAQAQAQIVTLRNELVAKKTQVEAEIGYIDAQILGTKAAIKAIETNSKAKMTGEEIIQQADTATKESFTETINSLQRDYQTDVQNMNTWTQAVLTDLNTATEAWGRYWKAAAGDYDGNLDDLQKEARKKSDNVSWEGAGKYVNKKKTYNKKQLQGLLDGLREYEGNLENLKSKYQSTLELYNTQIGLLDNLKGADLSKLGQGGSGSGSDNKLTQYIGKLKEIYNILNRIQVLEHRLSTLDAYADVASGERYGNLLKERLSYNEELLDQYEFLTREQKQFTNGYKDFIQSIEGLEGVFDFDKYGQIIINWDKYVALQDVAIDNEVTLKQKADDVYETYTQMFTDLQGYFDKTIDYYKQVIKLQREMVDNYMALQDKTANAIKEIYKKILDTKLDAIDQEKEALNELKEARDRANKDTKNAKAVSDLQTNLQRAMMDTSGASDTAFIKSQKDIQNKLDEIAEDKYSTMLSDIQKKLDEEKDALQREFDDMFEQLDWLFEWIDTDIMTNKDAMYDIFEQTDEWNQSSFLKRQDMLEEWETKFHSYYASVIENDKGIYGIYQNITDTRARIDELDKNLQQSISKGSYDIARTLGEWSSSISSAISAAASSGSGGSYGGYPGGGGSGGKTYTKQSIGAINVPVNSDVQYGTFNNESDDHVMYQPNNVAGSRLHSTGYTAGAYGISKNSSGYKVSSQTLWVSDKGQLWVWNGTKGRYERANTLLPSGSVMQDANLIAKIRKNGWYATGGLVDHTGPGWLDGTKQNPELVLNALQTKHFIDFVDVMDRMYSNVNPVGVGGNSAVTIGAIEFQVDSMSSPEDGEKAFNMFVDKFKEIGNQTGIKINSFKNTL